MHRGGSLKLDAPKQHKSIGVGFSAKKHPVDNPQSGRAAVLTSLRKYHNLPRRRVRYEDNLKRDASFQFNTNTDSLVKKDTERAGGMTTAFRISPRMRRVVNSRRGPIEPTNTSVDNDSNYFVEDLKTVLGGNAPTDIPTESYQDYHNAMKQAANMSHHIKVEVMKPINLPKKSKHARTVVLDLDETLVHCVYGSQDRDATLMVKVNGQIVETGVNVRPHAKEFLRELSQMAEIVVWTASQSNYADAAIDHLDPDGKYVLHRLYRDYCTFSHGVHLKDLRRLNRPLQHIAIVDNSVYCYLLAMENGVPVLPFYQDPNDTELPKLLEYLKQLLPQPDLRTWNSEHFQLGKYKKQRSSSRNMR